ncbi:MAG: cytochrome b [Alphaproteobacteria bacterium]|nr:MAG: cytochrome b [Alphaproteobacteria bacterium]
MVVKNTETSYGVVAKVFHWGMFLILFGLVVVGLYMSDLPADTPEQMGYKFGLYDQHKSFGILILGLVVFRLVWRMINPVPKMPDTMSRLEGLSAHAMHMLLYVIMLAQPLFGWLMSSFGGYPVKFFGIGLPALAGKDKAMGDFFHEAHEITALLLIVAFAVHVGAALFHHFVRKDDVMTRMSPHSKKLD